MKELSACEDLCYWALLWHEAVREKNRGNDPVVCFCFLVWACVR